VLSNKKKGASYMFVCTCQLDAFNDEYWYYTTKEDDRNLASKEKQPDVVIDPMPPFAPVV